MAKKKSLVDEANAVKDPVRDGFVDVRWWNQPEKEVWRKIGSISERLTETNRPQMDLDARHYRLYQNLPINTINPSSVRQAGQVGTIGSSGNRVTFNICRSVPDAFTAEMALSKPKAMFLTNDGDWELQQQAKNMDRWCEGILRDLNFYPTRHRVILDSCIFGDGCMKVWDDPVTNEIHIERVIVMMLYADVTATLFSKPRTIYERRWVDRLVLTEAFPEAAEAIRNAPRVDNIREGLMGWDSTCDQIIVTESYHLRSGKNAKDGKHAMVINGKTLLVEDYDEDEFPYTFWRRQENPIGWRSVGLIEELAGIQREINYLLRKISKSVHLGAVNRVVAEEGSVDAYHVDNNDGSILFVKKGAQFPIFNTGAGVLPEVYSHLDRLYAKAYEISGISQLQASAQKPGGLDSGEALRVYNDTSSRRFAVAAANDEEFVLSIVRKVMAAARRIIARGGSVQVKSVNNKSIETLDFADIALAEKEHILTMYPTSALSKDPAERISQVGDWVQAGWMQPDEAKRLLDFPDVAMDQDYENASYDLTMKIIDDIRNKGIYTGPISLMNLDDARRRMQLAALKAIRENAPEDRVQMFQRWIQQATDILTPKQPPMPPGAPPGPTGNPPVVQPGPPQGPQMAGPPPQAQPPLSL